MQTPTEQSATTNTILIIDDNQQIREMLKSDLEMEGYTVYLAKNGEEGLRQLKTYSPSVIILDLNMPVMGGIEFLKKLDFQNRHSSSIIVLTGYGSDDDIEECYSLGIQSFLRKPVNIFELEGLVKRSFDLISYSNRLEYEILEKKRVVALLKNTFDGMAEGVLTLNNHFKIEMVSKKACQILGIKEKDTLQKSATSILGVPVAGPSGILVEVMESGKAVSDTRVEFLSPSGAKLPVYLSIKPIEKPDDRPGLLVLFRDMREEERFMMEKAGGVMFGEMVSCSNEMKEIFKLIDNIATSNATVLIEGDTGTGKELVAKEIHARSNRAHQSFHTVNCAAIPPNLLESELFGHEKGAFTGAYKTKQGRFEAADRGTLFLDEIAEIPLELQVKLLRVLQEQEFERVGSTKSIEVDIRIVAATNQNLQKMVSEQRFRDDLFYRLDVISMKLPPLNDRLSDVPILATHFIEILNRKENRKVRNISANALRILLSYEWPGNIRELFHVLEYAFAVSKNTVLTEKHLPKKLTQLLAPSSQEVHKPKSEKEAILYALEKSGFHKAKTAAMLGISYVTLYRKIKKFNI